MKTAHIVNYHYFDETGTSMTVGGVQTYITNLSNVLKEIGFSCIIYQCAVCDFEKFYNGIPVLGFRVSGNNKTRAKMMRKLMENRVTPQTDLVIYASELLSTKWINVKTITIEHGIGWDIPEYHQGYLKSIIAFTKKAYHSFERIRFSSQSDLLVCVDYNFMNWYRASTVNQRIKYAVIPNFAEVAPCCDKPTDRINIIFARRLISYRGTREICDSAKMILTEFPNNVYFFIAGTGPDLGWMSKEMEPYNNRVTFCSYNSNDSLKIHADKHIAIVPTVGSEGTSLSLLEAMSAQCAVICTDVGGMTNVVIDNFNGIMINSGDTIMLYHAIKKLIQDDILRSRLAKKGYETVAYSFSFDMWASRWKDVICSLMDSSYESSIRRRFL